jgi:hypothetical protein
MSPCMQGMERTGRQQGSRYRYKPHGFSDTSGRGRQPVRHDWLFLPDQFFCLTIVLTYFTASVRAALLLTGYNTALSW